MSEQITVCVVDDDATVRASLAALMDSVGIACCEFGTFKEFSKGIKKLKCDCILLDVWLPDGNGLDLLQEIRTEGFSIPVIIITGHGDVPMAVKSLHLGAADFIEKPFDPDALLETIERVSNEYAHSKENRALSQGAEKPFATLTPREREVLCHLVDGQSNKTIALNLGLSPRTVEVHRARVMEKTKANSLSHLVRMAIAAGIASAD